MNTQQAAMLLLAARKGQPAILAGDTLPANAVEAFAVQDATMARLQATGGWKVGAKDAVAEPMCAPLPASGLLVSGVSLTGPQWVLRGVEVEVALRLGRDLAPGGKLLSQQQLAAAFDAVLPVMEVVETRLANWSEASPLAKLADLQSHGALVMGAPSAFEPAELNLETIEASLSFDGKLMANTRGANPAKDLWRMLAWLALHCEQRGHPLRAGQIVTTGSCTGMLQASAGMQVRAELAGIGRVEIQF